MIVRQEWTDDGNLYWVEGKPRRGDRGDSLQYHRVVPRYLWRAYLTVQALLDILCDRIETSPELPEYIIFREAQARKYEKRMKIERSIADEAARDRAVQEEIRRAGALAPLLKDCPTDEPVRIA